MVGIDKLMFDSGLFASREEALAAASDVGGNAVFQVDGTTTVTLMGVSSGSLSVTDILLDT